MYDLIRSLREGGNPEDGSYVGARLSAKSKARLRKMAKEIGVPKLVPSSKMHITLIYSRKYLPDFKPRGKLDEPMKATVEGLTVFQQEGGPRVLVVKLKSADLKNRHEEIMDEHKATYDFDEYVPHVTLCYDCGDFDETEHSIKNQFQEPLEFDEEYYEDLDLNWVK